MPKLREYQLAFKVEPTAKLPVSLSFPAVTLTKSRLHEPSKSYYADKPYDYTVDYLSPYNHATQKMPCCRITRKLLKRGRGNFTVKWIGLLGAPCDYDPPVCAKVIAKRIQQALESPGTCTETRDEG